MLAPDLQSNLRVLLVLGKGANPMKYRPARLLALFCALLPAGGWLPLAAQSAPDAQAPSTTATDPWLRDLTAWRTHREQEISAPGGWLTLVGLEWLKPGMNSVGTAADNQIRVHAQAPDHIGLLAVNGKPPNTTVKLLAPHGGFPPDLTLDGKPAVEGPIVTDDAKPSTLAWHGLALAVLRRGDRFVLRIKDNDSPARVGFHGLNWYPPDPRYRVIAKWTPFTPPHIEKIPTVLGTTLDLPSPGVAEFTLDGKTIRLEPVIEPGQEGTLFFIMRDVTSQITTYETARYLHPGLPDHGLDKPGLLTLDFNRLENPPCAYSTYATCPLPPEQNQLDIALEAGEQLYTH